MSSCDPVGKTGREPAARLLLLLLCGASAVPQLGTAGRGPRALLTHSTPPLPKCCSLYTPPAPHWKQSLAASRRSSTTLHRLRPAGLVHSCAPRPRLCPSTVAAAAGKGDSITRQRACCWEESCQEVRAFVTQHGRLPRQKGSEREPLLPEEGELGEWCNNQRRRRRGTKQGAPLSADEVATLASIPGWLWNEEELWAQRVQEVKAFLAQHGRLPRTKARDSQPGEAALGIWCMHQRQRHRRTGSQKPLSEEQVAALEAINGWEW